MNNNMSVAVIGLGNMGIPMAKRWLAAGYEVHGFDVSPSAQERLTEIGGIPHATAAAAAVAAGTTVLMLPNSAIVDAVLKDFEEADALLPGSVIIDMSSSEPLKTRANAEWLSARDVTFFDAPVSGGVRGAVAGTLTVMAGGESDVVESHRTLLECVGKVIPAGPVGAGHAVKALNNLLSATHLWQTSEAVYIAEKFGVAPETMLEVVNNSSGRSGSSEVKWPNFIIPETYNSGFEARLMLKDAQIATSLAELLGLPTSLGNELVKEWSLAMADLPAGADHTEVARWLKQRRHKASD
jgi:3-hydroxyisobutyrate dehydrogenase